MNRCDYQPFDNTRIKPNQFRQNLKFHVFLPWSFVLSSTKLNYIIKANYVITRGWLEQEYLPEQWFKCRRWKLETSGALASMIKPKPLMINCTSQRTGSEPINWLANRSPVTTQQLFYKFDYSLWRTKRARIIMYVCVTNVYTFKYAYIRRRSRGFECYTHFFQPHTKLQR